MTDNEKRAHDLAVSILPKMFDLRIDEIVKRGEKDVSIDLFAEYLDVYNKSLESFNRHFPDGK